MSIRLVISVADRNLSSACRAVLRVVFSLTPLATELIAALAVLGVPLAVRS